jgi:ribose transport system ATP-binding protein
MSATSLVDKGAPRDSSSPPLLELRGICKAFPGVKVLDDVSFSVWPGEFHMLLGENGAGKSSLMKVLCGAYGADAGEFFHHGEKVAITSSADARRLGIAVIFQEFSLVPYLDIAQNIFLGREPEGRIPGTIDRRKLHRDARPSGNRCEAGRGTAADGRDCKGCQSERAHPGDGRADGGALGS